VGTKARRVVGCWSAAIATTAAVAAGLAWSLAGIWLPRQNPVLAASGGNELRAPDGVQVGVAVFVANRDFAEARRDLVSRLEASFGVQQEGFCTDYSPSAAGAVQADNPVLWSCLTRRGAQPGGAECQQLTTRPYNVLPPLEGSSTLYVEILDAMRLLGRRGAVLLIRRVDRWRNWGRGFHTGVRIPFRVSSETYLVTDREEALVREAVGEGRLFLPDQRERPVLDSGGLKAMCAAMPDICGCEN
jgi:hypothetical protein